MKRIALANLKKYPAEYVRRVLEVATISTDDIVAVSEEDFQRLHQPPLPPLATRARNLAVQSAEELAAIAQGVPAIPAEESDRRIEICRSNSCGNWRKSDETCSLCGCPMARKAPWRSARCPIGMW